MPNFKYVIYDSKGKEVKGSIEATSVPEAKSKLKEQGLTPISVEEESFLDQDFNFSFGAKKVKVRDLSVFCRQFVSIINAGVSIVQALEMLTDQTENPAMKEALGGVMASVQKGETLSNSMKRERAFPSLLVNMVEAGESSGSLETSFERMSEQFEKDARLKSMIKKAMIYPCAILIVMVLVVAAMLIFVIPTYVGMFDEMGVALPLPTQIVIAASNFLVSYWYLVALGIGGIAFGIQYYKKTPQGAYFFADMMIKMPLFGNLTVKSASAQFARTLSTLLSAGVPMMESLEIVAKTMGNLRFKDLILRAKEEVASGRPLSEPLKAGNLFPSMIVHMIGIGEETGNLESMLDTTAGYFEEEVETATSAIATAVEPLIIVLMAGVVGGIIMAVMAPMFSMYEAFGSEME